MAHKRSSDPAILGFGQGVPKIELPPTFEIPDAQPAEPQKRFILGWVLLILIFTLVIAAELGASFSRKPEEKASMATQEMQLKQSLSMLPVVKASSPPRTDIGAQFEPVFQQLRQVRNDNPKVGELLVAAQYEVGKPTKADLDVLAKSDPKDAGIFQKVYGEKPPTKAEAKALQSQIPSDTLAGRLARIHALERAGEPAPDREKLFPKWKALLYISAMLAGIGLLFIGIAVWAGYITARRHGNLKPLGHPTEPLTLLDADRFAAIAGLSVIVFQFVVAGAVLATGKSVPQSLQLALGGCGFLVLLAVVFSGHVMGPKVSLKTLAGPARSLGRNILWGVGGWLAHLPLFAINIVILSKISENLPAPTHPVQEMLQQGLNFTGFVGLVLAGAVIAPIWEEIIFRGTLFPAISRVAKSPVWGVVVSSFLFASIHPQGMAGWLALATIAAVNACLTYQTGSIVPAIVLHALHNFTLLTAGYVLFS